MDTSVSSPERRTTAAVATASNPGALLVPLLGALYFVVLLRTAWVSDDAYITFRTIDNLLDGFGLRWNVADRVQAYTHPLWMFLVAALTVPSGEPYYGSLCASFACSISVVVLFARHVVRVWQLAVLGLAAMLASQAFVDYSSSGLENPLTHLLLVVFLLRCWNPETSTRSLGIQSLVGSLLMMNRLDAGILVLPALVAGLLRRPSIRTMMAAAIGFLPLLCWEAFSIVYYGFPFPNTAYAKLSTGIGSVALMRQGILYLQDSLVRDPITLTLITTGLMCALLDAPRRTWPLALGVVLHLAYVVRIGGDFMSGRFLTPAFVVGLCLFGRYAPAAIVRLWPAALACVVAIGCLSPPRPLTSDATYGGDNWRRIPANGIADERRFYYPGTGLLRMHRLAPTPRTDEPERVRKYLSEGRTVVARDAVGFFGTAAGRRIHVVDVLGLGDPLLAHLPAQRPWRIGHFYRQIPPGYIETLESGTNRIADPSLAAYYDRLTLITRGPIWTRERLRTIAAMNLGRYDHLLPAATE